MGIMLTLRCFSKFTRHWTTSWQIFYEGERGLSWSLVSRQYNNGRTIVLLPKEKTLPLCLFSVLCKQPQWPLKDLPSVFKLLLILKPKATDQLQAEQKILAAQLLSEGQCVTMTVVTQSGGSEMQIW